MFTRRAWMWIGAYGLGANRLAAAEPWEKKAAAEWDAKDVEKLMNKSPWARKFPVDTGRGPAAFSGVGAPKGGGGGGGRGPQGGGGDLGDEGPPGGGGGGAMGAAPEALVRWESAAPVLEAQKRQLPDPFRSHYAISIAGFPLGGGPGGGGPRPGGPGGPNLEALRAAQQAAFEKGKDTTWLARKGKDPIHPAVIAQAGRALLLLFPQPSPPIQIEDKEVTLIVRIGVPEMKAKFNLKDMVYQGKLEL